MIDLRSKIREVPDFPEPGIGFKDITPLLLDPEALKQAVDQLAVWSAERKPDLILGIESRGFIFGTALAHHLNKGFIPISKPGKLPWKTASQSYELEYGSDNIEIHLDALQTRPGRSDGRRPARNRRHDGGRAQARAPHRRQARSAAPS